MTRRVSSRLRRSLVLAVLAAGCGDDTPTSPPAPTSAAPADAGTPAIPLTAWVEQLVDERGADEATPDTVHDKNIVDAEDPTTFDKYFAPAR